MVYACAHNARVAFVLCLGTQHNGPWPCLAPCKPWAMHCPSANTRPYTRLHILYMIRVAHRIPPVHAMVSGGAPPPPRSPLHSLPLITPHTCMSPSLAATCIHLPHHTTPNRLAGNAQSASRQMIPPEAAICINTNPAANGSQLLLYTRRRVLVVIATPTPTPILRACV